MIETGLNETDFGKLILAGCFITDLGTVVALGACFANYDWSLVIFAVVARGTKRGASVVSRFMKPGTTWLLPASSALNPARATSAAVMRLPNDASSAATTSKNGW